jgi:hypothetical protein
MKVARTAAWAAIVVLMAGSHPSASGSVGFYGLIERVVFEPNAASPERVQVWGVFAYADGGARAGGVAGMSRPERGYLYFTLPVPAPRAAAHTDAGLVRREWADLAAVAGTGQAVAFGLWGYFGRFGDLEPAQRLSHIPGMYVRPPSGPPATPAPYWANAGVVRLSDRGSHAAIVARLREHLGTGPAVKNR